MWVRRPYNEIRCNSPAFIGQTLLDDIEPQRSRMTGNGQKESIEIQKADVRINGCELSGPAEQQANSKCAKAGPAPTSG